VTWQLSTHVGLLPHQNMPTHGGLCHSLWPVKTQFIFLRPSWSNEHLTTDTFMKITNQLPLFATYLVFTVHNIIPHYMFRLYGHLQVSHIYKNAKIILKLNGSVNLVSKWTIIQVLYDKTIYMYKNYLLQTVKSSITQLYSVQ
jgi:hypothetical protein